MREPEDQILTLRHRSRTALSRAVGGAAAKERRAAGRSPEVVRAPAAPAESNHSVPIEPTMPPVSRRIPINQRLKAILLPNFAAGSANGWSMVLLMYGHLVVGLGSNPRVPIDHNLLRWMLDAPCGAAAPAGPSPCSGELWMWKRAAGLYCLVVASSHPQVETWSRLPVDSKERRIAEEKDADGLIQTRRWFDGLLRPEGNGDETKAGGPSTSKVAERFLDWSTTKAIINKLAWLETAEGRRLVTRLWKDALCQPYGLISLSS